MASSNVDQERVGLRLSLVIPCYNEARNLPKLVERCARLVREHPRIDVVLVDNGSQDDTPRLLPGMIAGQPGLSSIRIDVNKGYGHGIVTGLRNADGELIGWTHADHQTDPFDAVEALALAERASEPRAMLVKGRRYGRPIVDRVFTAGMSIFETLLTRRGMRDINAQPTVFHRTFFERWESPPDDFALDLYAYWRARDEGFTILRFPVRFGPRLFGVSHWNAGMLARWKFIKRTLAFSLELSRRPQGQR